jgi:AcrR family transcriptional regulator
MATATRIAAPRSLAPRPRIVREKSAPGKAEPEKLGQILRASAQVFSEKGYDGASIRDVSRATGISLSGLYYYVKSKQEILYLIQICTFRTILARLERRLAGLTDPGDRLRALVQNHLDYFLRHPHEMKVLSREDEALQGDYAREVGDIKRSYYTTTLAIFEELRGTGRARRMNGRVAVLSLFGMMNWAPTWYRPQTDPQAGALADTMAGLFLHGIGGNMPGRASRNRVAQHRGETSRGARISTGVAAVARRRGDGAVKWKVEWGTRLTRI